MLMIAYAPVYVLPLPEDHRFPMLKYELIPEQLLHEEIVLSANFFSPVKCTLPEVLLTHDETYVQRMLQLQLTDKEMRKIGFPLTQALIDREFIIAGGTLQCCDFAFQNGASMNVAGGTHHAYSNSGEGFCLLNDVAVSANVLLHRKQAKKILVVDLDVHQGQGTAKIFEENNEVFTFSIHGKNNYPLHKEKSDLDIELADGTNGKTYLEILAVTLPKLLKEVQPDFAFYISGVDVLENDRYGRLKLTTADCMQRDVFVYEQLSKYNIPVVTSMGGGYSRDLKTIVNAHVNTFKAATHIYA